MSCVRSIKVSNIRGERAPAPSSRCFHRLGEPLAGVASPVFRAGRLASVAAAAAALAGCAATPGWNADGSDLGGPDRRGFTPVAKSAMPSVVQPYARIEETLACIRSTGVLHGKTFVVGPFADSTGKINAVAPGATGNFIPQGGSAAYITDALTKAGGRVVSTYFGPPAKAVPAQYAVNGIFNSLDFGTPVQADVRVAGIGPTVGLGWAQLSMTVQLDEVATRVNRQMSMIQRPVRYTQLGVGSGRDFNGTLVTGNVALQNQERLQLEALNGPIALGIADVVFKEFSQARHQCRGLVADLLDVTNQREVASLSGPMKAGVAGWQTRVTAARKD